MIDSYCFPILRQNQNERKKKEIKKSLFSFTLHRSGLVYCLEPLFYNVFLILEKKQIFILFRWLHRTRFMACWFYTI
jgi:hypothetical protein